MIIAVQKGMSTIKRQLEHRGHKVVYSDEYNHPIDVMIHKGAKIDSPLSNSLTSFSRLSHGNSYNGAVMEINAEGKSIRDIEMMLFSKRYDNTQILS